MSHFTDIPQGGWKLHLPPRLVVYLELARLDRPIGIWLLLFPCFWGLALTGGGSQYYYGLFAIGAVVMRGAGCTLNDIIDRKIDAQVERTKNRPLPSGRIGVVGALFFLVLQLLIGLAVLSQFDLTTIVLGCASLGLVAIYPLMKRVTWWPQFVLGLAFNWGIILAWSATGTQRWMPAILLYLSGVAWTLAYDTIYAHQDRRDDAAIGVRSTALRFGVSAKMPIIVFYIVFFALVSLSGFSMALYWKFYLVLAATASFSAFIVLRWDAANPASCLAAFKANRWIGLAVFAAIVVGHRCL